jgi:hypothetical protein
MVQQERDLVDLEENSLEDNLRVHKEVSNGLKSQLAKEKQLPLKLLLLKQQVYEMVIVHEI